MNKKWSMIAGFSIALFTIAVGSASAQVTSPSMYEGNKITTVSTFDGYNSLVNRPTTDGQPAYDYSVHIIKTGEDTGNRYRAFLGGRWKSAVPGGDGDHIMQYTSGNGAPNTWGMWSFAPEFLQGKEDGNTGKWFSDNVMEPEVVQKADGTWLMYVQVEIGPGMPIDIAGQFAASQSDRIMLLTSTDNKNWTRKEDRGVITNITNPTNTQIHHQEVIYVPWDTTGKPYWLYAISNVSGVMDSAHFRIRSSDPTTFNYTTKETTSGMEQLGNQIGYMEEAAGGPIFTRVTFVENLGKQVPALQYSNNGLNWGEPTSVLEGPTSNVNNNNTYFLGLSTINGTGKMEYLGSNKWKAIYGAATSNTPVAPEIFNAEAGMGTVEITVDGTQSFAFDWGFNTNGNTNGWTVGGQSSMSVTGGINTVTTTGTDPSILSPNNLNLSASANKFVKVRMKNNTSSSSTEMFFTTTTSTVFSQDKSAKVFTQTLAAGYTEYIFDMSANSAWTGTIKQLRFDPVGAAGTVNIDYIKVSEWGYLYSDYTKYWGFNTNGYVEGFIPVNQLSQAVTGGVNTFTTTGSDPYIYSPGNMKIPAATYKKVRIQMKNATSSTSAQLYFRRTTDASYAEARSVAVTTTANEAGYTEYVFDFTGNASWNGLISDFRFDPANGSGNVKVNYMMLGN